MEMNNYSSNNANNYKSVTPLKKKARKVTSGAALIACVICLIVGLVIGKGFSSEKKVKELETRIAEIQKNNMIETDRLEAEIAAHKEQENKLKQDLAEAKKNASSNNDSVLDKSQEAEAEEVEETQEGEENKSSGFLGKLIIAVLVVIIIVCGLFAWSIISKRGENDDDEYDDDEYDDEYDEYDEEEYDEEEYEDEE